MEEDLSLSFLESWEKQCCRQTARLRAGDDLDDPRCVFLFLILPPGTSRQHHQLPCNLVLFFPFLFYHHGTTVAEPFFFNFLV